MIDLKETLLGGKPMQAGTWQIFIGLHILLAGILAHILLHMEGAGWGGIALGAVVAARGAIGVSQNTK